MAGDVLLIQAVDGLEHAFWDGTSWVDDPLDAQTYTEVTPELGQGLRDARDAGPPDGMRTFEVQAVDASHALALKGPTNHGG